MKHYALFPLMFALALPAQAAPSASELAESMKQARLTEGFSVRMNVAVIHPDKRREVPFKIAVIGQVSKDRQRLLVRGLSPDAVRNRYYAVERDSAERIRAIAWTGDHAAVSVDPTKPLYDSGLVLWDMLAPWWDWPQRLTGTTGRIAGRDCMDIDSRAPEGNNSAIREVTACVDGEARISLNTRLRDRNHVTVRSIEVKKTMRKESGALAANKLVIAASDGTVTEIEVYSGDEHYLVTPDTFAKLDAYAKGEK